jgi:SAM-dependent methyltransferase
LRRAGHFVRGIDVDPEAIRECAAAHPEIDARLASGDCLPFDNACFDIVLSLDVFEHIRDSDRHLREVRRVLKPEGTYLLQTPNKWTNIPFEMLRHGGNFIPARRKAIATCCRITAPCTATGNSKRVFSATAIS